MDARLLFMGTVIAAMAGGVLAAALVGGPLWLAVPGLLGAALPAAATRARGRRQHAQPPAGGQPWEPSAG